MKAAPITLEILNKKIKGLIKKGLDSYWLIAEISELSINYSGHCYLEFIQKSEKSEKLIARARAVIWSNTFRMIQPYFETTTGQAFEKGIKVMVRVVVEFHETYGLSLNVVDIEPTYTVGEIAVRRQKILDKLNSEGVIDMNKELDLPYFLKRIAIISSKTAAGLKDFNDQLKNNPNNFNFQTKLFPAIMQGNEAEGSIINQLDTIYEYADAFDAVIIIRGGGASADLECFNSYWMAYNIAQFPLPVITGIGHEQDESVIDIVANTNLKTPTAVAEFLIDKMAIVENDLLLAQESIIELTNDILTEKKYELSEAAFAIQKLYHNRVMKENKLLHKLSLNYIASTKTSIYQKQKQLERNKTKLNTTYKRTLNNNKASLQNTQYNLKSYLGIALTKEKHRIDKSEQTVHLSNPKNILKKGYSITLKNGRSVKDGKTLKKGDEIETVFHTGKKRSTVK